jgi:hypothetical protein
LIANKGKEMLTSLIGQDQTLNNELEDYFEEMSDYDAPFFLWVKLPENSYDAMPVIDKLLDAYRVYETKFFIFNGQHLLLIVDCELEEVRKISLAIPECLALIVHIGIYKHNCLNSQWVTLQDSFNLLNETAEHSLNQVGIRIIDFHNKKETLR